MPYAKGRRGSFEGIMSAFFHTTPSSMCDVMYLYCSLGCDATYNVTVGLPFPVATAAHCPAAFRLAGL